VLLATFIFKVSGKDDHTLAADYYLILLKKAADEYPVPLPGMLQHSLVSKGSTSGQREYQIFH
jgi:hypothetical protein